VKKILMLAMVLGLLVSGTSTFAMSPFLSDLVKVRSQMIIGSRYYASPNPPYINYPVFSVLPKEDSKRFEITRKEEFKISGCMATSRHLYYQVKFQSGKVGYVPAGVFVEYLFGRVSQKGDPLTLETTSVGYDPIWKRNVTAKTILKWLGTVDDGIYFGKL
jgi:hypothetical protein